MNIGQIFFISIFFYKILIKKNSTSELSSGEPFGLIDMPIPFYSQISIEIINQIAR